ncbi:clathrin light chain CLC1 [Sporobolomyces salmoneus]|uniref:clathrin light chain CLC1 n=1 Tax=Sporobolomyces salmoneus TaxID=183962 RepID=UPI00317C68F5
MDDLFGTSTPKQDPQADFLARERAALGADFDASASSSSTGLPQDKDFEQSASAFPDLDGGDDALDGFTGGAGAGGQSNGGMGQQVSVTGTNEFAQFEQEYPEVEIPSEQPALHSNGFDSYPTESVSNYANPYSQPTSFVQPPQPNDDESEFIQTWKAKQAQEIAERESKAQQKKEETIAKARNAIDNFYKDYNSKKEKSIAQNKEDEEKFQGNLTESLAQGTTWERICQLVDLSDSRSKTATKSKQDLSRFKEVLLSLKREGENAPGAGGY